MDVTMRVAEATQDLVDLALAHGVDSLLFQQGVECWAADIGCSEVALHQRVKEVMRRQAFMQRGQ